MNYFQKNMMLKVRQLKICKSALSYTYDDIYQKLYRFLGYGYDE